MKKLSFHQNHQWLLFVIGLSFLTLSCFVAVIPAWQVQENNPALSQAVKPNDAELRGKMIYISEGCQACHTQQVRSNVIDQPWGNRPSIPADYAQNRRMNRWRNTASVLGSERTGPDLTNIGQRQPGDLWHLLHLYNPRAVIKESIMPAYSWLFQEVEELKPGQKELRIPSDFRPKSGNRIITTTRVEDLVAYLRSLKQASVPGYVNTEFQAYDWQQKEESIPTTNSKEVLQLYGAKLYSRHCKVCHQSDGKGIPGAFPSLAGSEYANSQDPSPMIKTVLFGLDRENEFGSMISFEGTLSDEEIAAILNYERSSWGNSGTLITLDQVRSIRNEGKTNQWPL